jgi:hypothetical protein
MTSASIVHPGLTSVNDFARADGDRPIVGVRWQGILAPPGTPRPIIETLNRAIRKVVAMPEVAEQLNGLVAIVAVGTPSN